MSEYINRPAARTNQLPVYSRHPTPQQVTVRQSNTSIVAEPLLRIPTASRPAGVDGMYQQAANVIQSHNSLQEELTKKRQDLVQVKRHLMAMHQQAAVAFAASTALLKGNCDFRQEYSQEFAEIPTLINTDIVTATARMTELLSMTTNLLVRTHQALRRLPDIEDQADLISEIDVEFPSSDTFDQFL